MRNAMFGSLTAVLVCSLGLADAFAGGAGAKGLIDVSKPALRGMIEFLSSDLLEGRAPGSRGAAIAESYVQSLFWLWDLAPAGEAGYLQPVPLKGYRPERQEIEAGAVTWKFQDDVLGTYLPGDAVFTLEAPAVFVGFGIATPIWSWDDFKDVDVAGKFLIARVNDPGLFDPSIFEGRELTYFGRWTYHMEEAARRKAAGILLIHSDETAGYGWGEIGKNWGRERLNLAEEAGREPAFRGWVREESFRRAVAARGLALEDLYRRSQGRDFRPVDLGFAIRVRGRQVVRDFTANNVIASIPGKSPRRIVISAHLDHLGMNPQLAGDTIFNGALDNGSALASMLLLAKLLKDHQRELYYTITVLLCNAEEAGLWGSRYYVAHTDRASIIANINFEATPVWEAAGSLMGVGARFSTFDELLGQVAKEQGLKVSEFSLVDQGFYFRSDQFPFAQAGIPAIWISAGEDDGSGTRKYTRYWKTLYHTVKDEFDPAWPLDQTVQTVRAAYGLIALMNRTRAVSTWKTNLTFPMEK